MPTRKRVELLHIPTSSDDLFKTLQASRTQGGNLGAAMAVAQRMYAANSTIFLSVAGAVTPAGGGGYLIDLIRLGLVDVIVTTGANITHDLHFALNTPLFHCDPHTVNDFELQKNHEERIYDIVLDPNCLPEVGKFIRRWIRKSDIGSVSSSQFFYELGWEILRSAPFPSNSFVAQAAFYCVPIYCAAPSDSEVGMNIAVEEIDDMVLNRDKKSLRINNSLDLLEMAGIFLTARSTGLIVIGGGHPKNYTTQNSPAVKEDYIYPNIRKDFPDQIHREPEDLGGLDFMIKISTDVPHFGGCSGATESENLTWNKLKPGTLHQENGVEVNADFSLALPILLSYIKSHVTRLAPKLIYNQMERIKQLALDIRKKRIEARGLESIRE